MYVKSLIYKNEKLDNNKPTINSSKTYYQTFVVEEDGKKTFALFTEHELNEAIKRGAKNPEDRGIAYVERPKWWKWW